MRRGRNREGDQDSTGLPSKKRPSGKTNCDSASMELSTLPRPMRPLRLVGFKPRYSSSSTSGPVYGGSMTHPCTQTKPYYWHILMHNATNCHLCYPPFAWLWRRVHGDSFLIGLAPLSLSYNRLSSLFNSSFSSDLGVRAWLLRRLPFLFCLRLSTSSKRSVSHPPVKGSSI